MTDDCNQAALNQARANVAAQYCQPYQRNAIMRGDWDQGKFIKDEMLRLLKGPAIEIKEEM